MKMIRFKLSNGDQFLFDIETAEMILASREQIVRVIDADGKWTGETVNKAFLVSTKIDWDETRHAKEKIKTLLESGDKKKLSTSSGL